MSRQQSERVVAYLQITFALLCLTLIYAPGVLAQSSSFDLTIRNDYIAISVNASDENTGRFALETTGGDPTRLDDDLQPLLFKQGGSGPRTSYTTVRVDGEDYVFGGASTSERAGYRGTFGTMVQAPRIVTDDEGDQKIVASWLLGSALVTQELGFARSSTTGLFDTAQIIYTIENVSEETAQIGLRVVLDTMLGANDGAPFRIGEQAILTDSSFRSGDLPDFWQAFDSLTDPRVIGQGTFRGAGITVPDRVYLSNWGALADGLWDFSFEPGRDFTRLGEFELDSAMALYWDPVPFQPGEKREYVTQYGLGGISIVRGALSLGITSPASIDAARESSFPVLVYVQNAGEGDALDVGVRICVPRGLSLPGNQSCETRYLGDLPIGREAQVSWNVELAGAVGGELEYTVEASAENLPEPVRVSRKIDVLGPPKLALSVDVPSGRVEGVFDRWNPPRQPIVATVSNVGATTAKDVMLSFSAPVGMELAAVDRSDRLIGELRPDESQSVTWSAALLGYTGNLPFTVTATDLDSNIPPVTVTKFLDMLFPQRGLLTLVGVGAEAQPARVGQVVGIDVKALNIRRMTSLAVELTYDPSRLRFIEGPPGLFGSLRGDLFMVTEEEQQRSGSGDEALLLPWAIQHTPAGPDGLARIRIEGHRSDLGALAVATGNVASLRFLALAPGESPIRLEVFRVGADGAAPSPEAPSQIEKSGVTVYIVP